MPLKTEQDNRQRLDASEDTKICIKWKQILMSENLEDCTSVRHLNNGMLGRLLSEEVRLIIEHNTP